MYLGDWAIEGFHPAELVDTNKEVNGSGLL